jgi:hypothetical protein
MSMNFERHMKAHQDLFDHIARGEDAAADAIRAFYDEYFAVLDLDADFYLETVRLFFQQDALARGTLTYHGRLVRPAAITLEQHRDALADADAHGAERVRGLSGGAIDKRGGDHGSIRGARRSCRADGRARSRRRWG